MHPKAPLQLSRSFLRAHHLCTGNGLSEGAAPRSAVVPGIVCLAFAAELGLKSLLLAESKHEDGHDLKVLFKKLNHATQVAVIERSEVEAESFEANLKAVANTFRKWRYIYQSTGVQSVSEDFLLMLNSGIQSVAREQK
ncbi:MAG: hypothetical protein IPP44_00550 [Ideonella sp.]|nr:hypothetical protein [Ideonella sp.]